MATRSRKSMAKCVRPRLRILCGDCIALGPGKADLLASIAETGSLAESANQLGMSYMRAWMLVQTMNRCFKEPLVQAVRGGSNRGGTGLTLTGKRALALYRKMEAASRRAAADSWKEMAELLAD